jgi:GT2 family glycosyltransferase
VPEWLGRPDVRILATGDRGGPARARNLAAESAAGDLLLFVDADVELESDAVERIREAFVVDPDLVAVFGSYDDEPLCPGVVSRFRNLLHHHTHAAHPGPAVTFWSGCGAILRSRFLDLGGFDEGFRFPSVEDIELGMRITAAGGRILLDPAIRCKHAKSWSLASMIYTDVVHRARPWTRLIASRRLLAPVLNVDWRGRSSGVLAVLAVVMALAAIRWPSAGWWAAGCLAGVVALNAGFYRLCLQKRGPVFMLAAIALHWLYFVYSSLTFGVILVAELLNPSGTLRACDHPAFPPSPSPWSGDRGERSLGPR